MIVLGMMVSRSAEITGCIGCNACESRCDEGLVLVLGMMVSRSAEITGCNVCNACES